MSTQVQQSSPLFPTQGWQTSHFWADLFDETDKGFRNKVRDKGIPTSKWGNVIVIRAEHMSAYFDGQVNRDGEEGYRRAG